MCCLHAELTLWQVQVIACYLSIHQLHALTTVLLSACQSHSERACAMMDVMLSACQQSNPPHPLGPCTPTATKANVLSACQIITIR